MEEKAYTAGKKKGYRDAKEENDTQFESLPIPLEFESAADEYRAGWDDGRFECLSGK